MTRKTHDRDTSVPSYGKPLALASIALGLGALAILVITTPSSPVAVLAALGGVVTIAAVTFLVVLDRRARSSRGLRARLLPSARASATVEMPATPDQVLALAKRAVQAVTGARITRVDEASHVVEAEVRAGRESWGERVTVSIQARDGRSVAVISSKPRVRTTLIDYGKNEANVRAIVERLERASRRLAE